MLSQKLSISLITILGLVIVNSDDGFWEHLKDAQTLHITMDIPATLTEAWNIWGIDEYYNKLEPAQIGRVRLHLRETMDSDPAKLSLYSCVADDNEPTMTTEEMSIIAAEQQDWKLDGVWIRQGLDFGAPGYDNYSIYVFHQNGTDDDQWFVTLKDGVAGDTLKLYHIPLLQQGRAQMPIQLGFLVDQESVLEMHAKYYSKIDQIKMLKSELDAESEHNKEWQTSYDQLVMVAAVAGVLGLVLLVMVIMLGITGCRLRRRKRAMTAKLEQMKVDEQVFLGDHVMAEELGKGGALKQGMNAIYGMRASTDSKRSTIDRGANLMDFI